MARERDSVHTADRDPESNQWRAHRRPRPRARARAETGSGMIEISVHKRGRLRLTEKDVLRFQEKLGKCVQDENGCVIWPAKGARGYGQFCAFNTHLPAHRVTYEFIYGPVDSLVVDHVCRNRSCVNVAHLRPLTFAQNIMVGTCPPAINARKTHCPRGHEMTTENTIFRTRGTRECRVCKNLLRRLKRVQTRHAQAEQLSCQ